MHTATTQGVSKVLTCLFSRYGVPEVVVADSGFQLNFKNLHELEVSHMQQPHPNPQSNSKVENTVKTIKGYLKML